MLKKNSPPGAIPGDCLGIRYRVCDVLFIGSSDFHNSNLFSEHLGTHCTLEL